MEELAEGRWARWRHLLLTTIGAAIVAGVGIALHVAFDLLPGEGQRPPPWLSRIPLVMAVLVGASALLWGRLAWIRRKSAGGWWVAGLATLHLVVVLGGLLLIVLSDPEFLFGKVHRDSLKLDDGRVAHLFTTGLFCGYEVYEERRGQLWVERVELLSRACADKVTLDWSPSGGYRALGADGEELPYKGINLRNLYLGPH